MLMISNSPTRKTLLQHQKQYATPQELRRAVLPYADRKKTRYFARENTKQHLPLALALDWHEGIEAIMPCEDRNELDSAERKYTTYSASTK